jgi:hypothetical protein
MLQYRQVRGEESLKVRIHKGVLECDKGDGKFVPQLCLRMMGVEMESFKSPPLCTTACPLLDRPCNEKKTSKKCKGEYTISGCEFEIMSEIPIEFDKDESQPSPKFGGRFM